MQFGLRTLIVAISVIALFCGLFFATPFIIEVPILALIVLVAPSVWICGACFSTGGWRPFFLGAICAAWLPHLILMYVGGTAATAVMTGSSSGLIAIDPEDEWSLIARLSIAVAFLFPGFCAFLGGACGVLVYRSCRKTAVKSVPAEPSKLRDAYVLVESRLTPLTPSHAEAQATTVEGRKEAVSS